MQQQQQQQEAGDGAQAPTASADAPPTHQQRAHQQQQLQHGGSILSVFQHPPAEPRTIGNRRDMPPRQPHTCNCKKSNCLKLYCECFANGLYCSQGRGCHCEGCCNSAAHEVTRREAIEIILDRAPHGFRPKIVAAGVGGPAPVKAEHGDGAMVGLLGAADAPDGLAGAGGGRGKHHTRHNKGCHCKRSNCLKKYCECFQAGVCCTEKCRCHDCRNFEGSEDRAKAMAVHGHGASAASASSSSAAAAAASASNSNTPGTVSILTPQQQQQQQLSSLLLGAGGHGSGPVILDSAAAGGIKRPKVAPGAGMEMLQSLISSSTAGGGSGGAGFAAPLPRLPAAQAAKLEANAANLLNVMRPQMADDLVMLMVNAAWGEGVAARKQHLRQQRQQAAAAAASSQDDDGQRRRGRRRPRPEPTEGGAQQQDDEAEGESVGGGDGDGEPSGQAERAAMEVGAEDEGLGCAEEGLEDDAGLLADEELCLEEDEDNGSGVGDQGTGGKGPVLPPPSTREGASSGPATAEVRALARRRQETTVLQHLSAGLRRLAELVARGKATGGGGGLGGGLGGGSTRTAAGGTYAYTRRLG